MSNAVVIRVENLSKEYRLGTISHGTLQRDLQSWWARIRGKEDPNSIISTSGQLTVHDSQFTQSGNPHFLALDNVSFEVHQGEVLGIIGRNGAGKSTLLKVLSKVTAPTSGVVKIKGRIASLLEVGTGFHPELTGRENVHLNGAILGMTKKEIASKFDEIVAFSEIEQFIDTPVKRYSSGMYVRLAFAVAAHLEPEILIIDEVLAVGDAAFQKKCLGKMSDVAKEGRTVLFVSHNMAAVSTLCEKTIYLDKGRIVDIDETASVLPKYLGMSGNTTAKGVSVRSYFQSNAISSWVKGSSVAIEISWEKYRFPPGWECDIASYTLDGHKIFAVQSQNLSGFSSISPEDNCITFFVENVGFTGKPLRLDVGIRSKPREPYSILLENCLLLAPDEGTLPPYKREDVLIVPNVGCSVSNK